jgi:Arc/MetJ-type ribon-helix-helix transcriptional regulator
MRSVVNISLPKELYAAVERLMEEGKYASKSELFREFLRMHLEEELLKDVEESRRQFRDGKGKLLRTPAELD